MKKIKKNLSIVPKTQSIIMSYPFLRKNPDFFELIPLICERMFEF